MSFTVSEELVQKIVPKSYAIESKPEAGQFVGERILMAVDVIGGHESRSSHSKGFREFNLLEHKSFLEELASTISYDEQDSSKLKNDNYFLEIVDLVKRDLYQWVQQNEVKYSWGYVKTSDSGDLIVSPPSKP